jgi:predicted transcriptional regulator
MDRFVDSASVLDDLEQQAKLELARRNLERRFDDYVREQIGIAVEEAARADVLGKIERDMSPDVRDTVNRIARDIERELSQIWLPEGNPCTTQK